VTVAARGAPERPRDNGVLPAEPPEAHEEKVADSVDRIVAEGEPRLQRTWLAILATGTVAGIEVSIGILAFLFVEHETHSTLLGGLAFGVGFLALLLGHSELFTEGFLVPVTTVVAGHGTWWQLARLWVGTLIGNLVGGFFMSWLMMRAYPDLRATAVQSATHFLHMPLGLQSFALALLAGVAITVMTRMQNGTDSVPAKVAASLLVAFVLAGTQLAHSVLESILAFAALHTGHAPFGYRDWLGWFGWTVFGNVIGGVGLVTVLRLVRSRELIKEQRADA
jgi:formate/nitrite transporter FocA (FNT family)